MLCFLMLYQYFLIFKLSVAVPSSYIRNIDRFFGTTENAQVSVLIFNAAYTADCGSYNRKYWVQLLMFSLILSHEHTCQPIRLKILEILFFRTLRSHSSKPLPPTARILSYLSSAQQDLTGEPHKNITKPLTAISTLNSGT